MRIGVWSLQFLAALFFLSGIVTFGPIFFLIAPLVMLLGLVLQISSRLRRVGMLLVSAAALVFLGWAVFILYSLARQGLAAAAIGVVVFIVAAASLIGAWLAVLKRPDTQSPR
jgi:hypothetical protein